MLRKIKQWQSVETLLLRLGGVRFCLSKSVFKVINKLATDLPNRSARNGHKYIEVLL